MTVKVTCHNPPVASFGSRGVGDDGFIQPCSISVDAHDNIYVVDTGNCRIKVLNSEMKFQHHIENENLSGSEWVPGSDF